jgi:hypothetical protein
MAPLPRFLLLLCSAWAFFGSAGGSCGISLRLLQAAPTQPRGSSASEREAKAQASTLYKDATELRRAGKPKEALRKLREAYSLVPTPTLLWPIAELCLEANEPEEGLDALRRYREQMTPEEMEPGQQIADAEKLEQRLRERQAAAANPAAQGGTGTPGGPDAAKPGDGFKPHPLTWAAVSVTGVVLLSATGVGAAALATTRSLQERCPDRLCIPSGDRSLDELNTEVALQRKLSISSQVLWSVGAALAVSTAALVIVDWKRQRSGRTLLSDRSLTLTPVLGPQGSGSSPGAVAGAVLGGRF